MRFAIPLTSTEMRKLDVDVTESLNMEPIAPNTIACGTCPPFIHSDRQVGILWEAQGCTNLRTKWTKMIQIPQLELATC